jgi:hypothetical protein
MYGFSISVQTNEMITTFFLKTYQLISPLFFLWQCQQPEEFHNSLNMLKQL